MVWTIPATKAAFTVVFTAIRELKARAPAPSFQALERMVIASATIEAGAVAVLTYNVAQRVHPLPYRGGRLAAMFLGATALAAAVQRLAPAGPAGIAVKLAAVLAVASATWMLGLWTDRGAIGKLPGEPTRGVNW